MEIRGHKPVGQYGNGFKSGSMRLGKDAVVFTKCKTTWSVGFLSQTFLAAINADTVLVPIITFDKATDILCCLTSTMVKLFCLHFNGFHSFIPDISIAPLQVHYYSEALLTTALILCRS